MTEHAVVAVERHAWEPEDVLPPGVLLADYLEENGITQADGARRLGVSAKHLNQVINGSATLSHDFALTLERATGVAADLWINWEARYQAFLARQREAERLRDDLGWLDELPLERMIGRGEIRDVREQPVEQLREVLRFFGVASKAAFDEVCAAERVQGVEVELAHDLDVATWLRVGELHAAQVRCQPFDRSAFVDVLRAARAMTTVTDLAEVWPGLVDACAASGVAVVLVRSIGEMEIDGAARWLTPSRALIQLSLRDRHAEAFWFSFFHAAGHVLQHSKKCTFLDPGMADDPIEEEADRFARDLLIPRASMRELRALTTEDEVRAFAQKIGVGTAIVAGRLHREGVLSPAQLDTSDLHPRYAIPKITAR